MYSWSLSWGWAACTSVAFTMPPHADQDTCAEDKRQKGGRPTLLNKQQGYQAVFRKSGCNYEKGKTWGFQVESSETRKEVLSPAQNPGALHWKPDFLHILCSSLNIFDSCCLDVSFESSYTFHSTHYVTSWICVKQSNWGFMKRQSYDYMKRWKTFADNLTEHTHVPRRFLFIWKQTNRKQCW